MDLPFVPGLSLGDSDLRIIPGNDSKNAIAFLWPYFWRDGSYMTHRHVACYFALHRRRTYWKYSSTYLSIFSTLAPKIICAILSRGLRDIKRYMSWRGQFGEKFFARMPWDSLSERLWAHKEWIKETSYILQYNVSSATHCIYLVVWIVPYVAWCPQYAVILLIELRYRLRHHLSQPHSLFTRLRHEWKRETRN